MHFSIDEEGSVSSHLWRRHLVPIWCQDFFQSEASTLENWDLQGRWYPSGVLYLPRGYDISLWHIDSARRHSSSQTTISSYFLEIVSEQWGISVQIPKKSTIAIRRRDIYSTWGPSISWSSRSFSIASHIDSSTARHESISHFSQRWIPSSRTRKM